MLALVSCAGTSDERAAVEMPEAPETVEPAEPAPEHVEVEPAGTAEVADSGWQVDKPGRAASGYSRALKLLYVEQRFRYAARFLNEALKRDTGLRYQGHFLDAAANWQQPVSLMRGMDEPEPESLKAPFYADGREIESRDEFLSQGYDVVIIGDVDMASIKLEHWDWLKEHVRDGGGLIMLCGRAHHPQEYHNIDAYTDLCPVVLRDRLALGNVDTQKVKYHGLTADGEGHEVMDLADNAELWGDEEDGTYEAGKLHGHYWHYAGATAKPDATVLARVAHEGEAIADGDPLVVARELGDGRVLWLGTDDQWYWRQFEGDKYFYKFWQNAIRWTANDA